MKKSLIFLLISFFSISLFAGKPLNKETSPLSVLSSQTVKDSWCEKEGYADVPGSGKLHY